MKPTSNDRIKQDHESVPTVQPSGEKLFSPKIKGFFMVDRTIGVSKFRFYLLRVFYFVIPLLLGIDV